MVPQLQGLMFHCVSYFWALAVLVGAGPEMLNPVTGRADLCISPLVLSLVAGYAQLLVINVNKRHDQRAMSIARHNLIFTSMIECVWWYGPAWIAE